MNKLPLRKCPQCRQVKREDITHICQACYAANAQEVREQEARYSDMPMKPLLLDRNLIGYEGFSFIPEPHEYILYWWRHFPEKHWLLLLALLTSCLISNSLTLLTHGISGAAILAVCVADMGVVAGTLVYFHAKRLFRWIATFCKNVWGGLATLLKNVQQFGRSLTYPFLSDEQDDALPFPLGESGPLDPPQGGSVIALPISPYTGQPYDPAWFGETGGGQSNTALLALMKRIEREIDERKNHSIYPSLRTEQALYDAGYTFQEVAKAVTQMATAGKVTVETPQPEYEQVQAMYPEGE